MNWYQIAYIFWISTLFSYARYSFTLCHGTKRCNDLCFILLKITSSSFPCTDFFVINFYFYLTKLYLLDVDTDSSSPVYLEKKNELSILCLHKRGTSHSLIYFHILIKFSAMMDYIFTGKLWSAKSRALTKKSLGAAADQTSFTRWVLKQIVELHP